MEASLQHYALAALHRENKTFYAAILVVIENRAILPLPRTSADSRTPNQCPSDHTEVPKLRKVIILNSMKP